MKIFFTLLAVGMPMMAAPVAIKNQADEPTELQGKWEVVAITTFGANYEDERIKRTALTLSFTGNQFRFKSNEYASTGTFKLVNAIPKRLELQVQTKDDRPVSEKEKSARWVYALNGEEVQMANSNGSVDLPEKFDPSDREQIYFKAKRVKE